MSSIAEKATGMILESIIGLAAGGIVLMAAMLIKKGFK